MPQGSRGCKEGVGRGWRCSSDGLEVAITIVTKNHASRPEVLHRKTKGIKFDRTTIVAGELTNGKEIANYGWDDKDVVQDEVRCYGGKEGLTTRRDWNTSAIAYNNRRMR